MKILLSLSLVFFLTSCSAIQIEQYSNANINYKEKSQIKNEISILAQAIIDKDKSKKYFGINLIDSGILAIHIDIHNGSSKSYMVPVDNIELTNFIGYADLGKPESKTEETGEVLKTVGIILLSPPLLFIAAQYGVNASIVKENFEAKMLRSKTIDSGQNVSGFTYFNWETLKELKKINLCLDFVDPIGKESFIHCVEVNLEEEEL